MFRKLGRDGVVSVDRQPLGILDVMHVTHRGGRTEPIRTDSHLLAMTLVPRPVRISWGGPMSDWQCRPACALGFIPRGTIIHSEHKPGDYSSIMVAIDDDVLSRAAGDNIICPRRVDLNSPLLVGMLNVIHQLTSDQVAATWPLLAESCALSLSSAVAMALRADPDAPVVDERAGLSEAQRRRVLDYIGDNLDCQITIAELADVAAMSPWHFARSFKASMGDAPHRYIGRLRVETAKRLLRTTSAPVAVVAAQAGFASQSHMTTVFRALVGVTPARYRRGALGALAAVALDWPEVLMAATIVL